MVHVPYIHCPQCRLTVYGGIAYKDNKQCPRCHTEMSQSPRPLFRSFGLRNGNGKASAPGVGEQLNPR